MSPPPLQARCARHPEVNAVDVCSRCGAFACGDCVEYLEGGVPACVSCAPRLRVLPPSRGTWATFVLGLASLLLVALGFGALDGVSVAAALLSLLLALAALVLGTWEAWRRRRTGAQARGRGWLWAGMAMACVALLPFAVGVALALLHAGLRP